MRRKRATKNIVTAIFFQLITLAVGLYLPKLYTETFGSVYNGLNQTVSQIMSFLAVLQAGLAAASMQAMYKPIAENNKSVISAIFRYTDRQYKKNGYIFITALSIFTIIWTLSNSESIPNYLIPIFMIIYGFNSSVEYFFQAKYTILIMAHNKSYILYLVNMFLFFIGTFAKIFILINIKNIVIYLLVLVFVSILRIVIMKSYVKKEYPFLTNENVNVDIAIKDRKDVLISEIAGLAINSTDLIVLSANCGLIFSSIYSVYYFVINGLGSILGSIREGFSSGLGQLYYENTDRFRVRFDQFETIYFSAMFFLYSVAIVLYEPFIKLYTENMDINYVYAHLPLLFIITALVTNLRIPSIVLINIAGHFKEVKRYAVMEAIINFVISFALSFKFGIYGVLVGTLIGGLYRTPILVNYSNKHIVLQNNFRYIKKVIILSIPFVSATIFSMLKVIEIESFSQWAFTGLYIFSLFAVLQLMTVFLCIKT